MNAQKSIDFFDSQFREQVRKHDFELNPFERAALPYLSGRVLDFGCGMGNLSFAAARTGCSVLALDASPAAIEHIRRQSEHAGLRIRAELADLQDYELTEHFDAVVCIGLLMFFDCEKAKASLTMLQSHVRPGGICVLNVLTEGTTYLDMFDEKHFCLFSPQEIEGRFSEWEILYREASSFDAPGNTIKSFVTVIARKP